MSDPILIDECLSVELPRVAHELGFEAYHVAHYGLSGLKDPALFAKINERGFIFVTNNREDFVDLIAEVDLHAGLIIILPNVRGEAQKVLFRTALEHILKIGSMLNRVLEIDGNCEIRVYNLPAARRS
jgi:predicted nuclease of predicted toxin-antitoxin system